MSDPKQPFNPAFAALAKLKAEMPATPPPNPTPTPSATPSAPAKKIYGGKIVVRREKKGRGGKTVTCVEGLTASPKELEALATSLKKALGCGATLEGRTLVLLGDLTVRVKAWLEADGAKQVILGN
ncbi:MAG: translation initiation factor [Deltaproteobacteria bacterium]|jgi:translation initiation factor 1|nr:translation initiation factor [Deltaproteobacteria bacterium]